MTEKPGSAESKSQPLYRRVQDFIRSEIASGALTSGDKIPTEHSLMKKFGASRMTVHRAVRDLSDTGLIRRIPGSGSFVTEEKPGSSVLKIADIAEEIIARGHRHCSEVVRLEEVTTDATLADKFNLAPGRPIFVSSVIHFEDAIPLQLENRFVNPSVAPDYLAQDFTTVTSYSYLQKTSPITRAVQSIHAVMPDENIRRHLDIDDGVPCLMIERATWSGRTVATQSTLIYPGNRYHLRSSIDQF